MRHSVHLSCQCLPEQSNNNRMMRVLNAFSACKIVIISSIQVADHDGLWIGVEWDDPERGKHNGTVNGVEYFETRQESILPISMYIWRKVKATFAFISREVAKWCKLQAKNRTFSCKLCDINQWKSCAPRESAIFNSKDRTHLSERHRLNQCQYHFAD